MGLHINLSVIYGKNSTEIFNCVKEYAIQTNGGIEPLEKETWYYDFTIVSGDNSSCILYPAFFFDEELSIFIAKKLSTSVISCMISDGDYWTYMLYNNGGELISWFKSNPGRAGIPEAEIDQWKGNANLVAQSFGNIDPETINKYFVFRYDVDDFEKKAYPDDVYAYRDEESMQLFDFIKKLGVSYPFDSTNSKIYLFWNDNFTKYEPEDYDDGPADEEGFRLPAPKKVGEKPWWKFW